MPHNYTGNNAITLVDPPTFSLPSDGDARAAASVNVPLQQAIDYIATIVHQGAFEGQTNVFTQANTFNGTVLFNGRVVLDGETDFRLPVNLTGASPQTIGVDQSDLFIVPAGTLPGSPVLVSLRETGPSPRQGARLRVVFQELSVGSNVWQFYSQTGPQLLTINDAPWIFATPALPPFYTSIEFYFDGTHWQVGAVSGMVVSIP
jgi:hypothetical protein